MRNFHKGFSSFLFAPIRQYFSKQKIINVVNYIHTAKQKKHCLFFRNRFIGPINLGIARVTKKALNEGEHEEFVRMVKTLLPDHKYPANERELRRMEVQSFRKSPHLWDKRDAPVAGKRFEDYLHLAQQTMEAFTEETV